jgi:hypothetical protein
MLKKNQLVVILSRLVLFWFAVSVVFWVLLQVFAKNTEKGTGLYLLFASTYGVVSLFGGVGGLYFSKRWGGLKSHLGKTLTFLSLALLFTEAGQIIFSFYNIILKVDLPYPSLADVGFFGAIPLYCLGAFYLLRTMNISGRIKRDNPLKTFSTMLIPMLMMLVTYLVNFRTYDSSGSSIIKIFLDFADPIGHSVYISFALIALVLSGRLFGGKLRKSILVILLAFLMQYVADLNFLFQDTHSTWVNGGYGDVLYLISYTLMSYGVLSIERSMRTQDDADSGEPA